MSEVEQIAKSYHEANRKENRELPEWHKLDPNNLFHMGIKQLAYREARRIIDTRKRRGRKR